MSPLSRLLAVLARRRPRDIERQVCRTHAPQPWQHAASAPSALDGARARLMASGAQPRLAGLRAWADYGCADVRHRQPALDVLCECLRALAWPGTEQDQRWRMVLQASLAACLRPGPGFWLDMDIDLSRGVLVDFDLSECRMRKAGFSRTRFVGDARFDETTFIGDVDFDAAWFTRHAVFAETVFAKRASFGGATFCGNGTFSGIHISGNATFSQARFSGRADFNQARFGGDTDYRGVRFGGRALFRRAGFAGASWFDDAWFRGREDFVGAVFGGESGFDGTRFGHRLRVD